MNHLDITVGGKTFAIGCEEGEDDDVRRLGAVIDAKFQQLAPRYDQNLLFAALLLADDLENARREAAEARSKELAVARSVDDMRREADTALGQRDQLRQTIAERERELDRLQSAQQDNGNELNSLREENAKLKEKDFEAASMQSQLSAALADAKDQIERLSTASASLPAQDDFDETSGSAYDPDLAPSLERFADLLENCVAKLEAQRPPP